MSYMKHQYIDTPAGRCSHCGKTRDIHDVPMEELLATVKFIADAEMARVTAADPRSYSEKMRAVLEPTVAEEPPRKWRVLTFAPTYFDELLGAIEELLGRGCPSDYQEIQGGSLCWYCMEAIGEPHRYDCAWRALGEAFGRYIEVETK